MYGMGMGSGHACRHCDALLPYAAAPKAGVRKIGR